MSIEVVLGIYAAVVFLSLVPLIWLLLKRKRKKAEAAQPAAGAEPVRPSMPIDWSAALAFRPKNPLSGEMWLKALIAAFIALCSAVIVIVFIFPLGAGWAAAATFVATTAIVGVIFTLVE